ncbi:LITAF domain-containing protein-like [Glandiceps talaboti]
MSEKEGLLDRSADQETPPEQVYGQPPPGGYQSTAATDTVVVQPTGGTVFENPYRDLPVAQRCPRCQQEITTRLVYKNGWIVWLSAGIICLLGGWLGCCLIPFCIKSIKNVDHYCPVCKELVGKYIR